MGGGVLHFLWLSVPKVVSTQLAGVLLGSGCLTGGVGWGEGWEQACLGDVVRGHRVLMMPYFPGGFLAALRGILCTRKTRLGKWTALARNAGPGLQAEFCLVPNPRLSPSCPVWGCPVGERELGWVCEAGRDRGSAQQVGAGTREAMARSGAGTAG